MKVSYRYSKESTCTRSGDSTNLGLSGDLGRDEVVSFSAGLKEPLKFRDSMLMLRDIVVSDNRMKKKNRDEFFFWLEGEIERRLIEHCKNIQEVKSGMQDEIDSRERELRDIDEKIKELNERRKEIRDEIESKDAWRDYNKLERKFWDFIRNRDYDLWFVLDPVITVHKDSVSFEAFSQDESTYGCLTIDYDGFNMKTEPKLGTTNIDFSERLAQQIKRFRTYNKVNLDINPGGFHADAGTGESHLEKKIDLPDSWVKGFTQVSSAGALEGIQLQLEPGDMYDICSYLRRNKANVSPRYMKWTMVPGENIKVTFMPKGDELILRSIYAGERKREEKIWGRRRWLLMEKIIPLAQKFHVKFLGFGMPQFITAHMDGMRMTIGFTSWSSNDWVKGTAFNILGGFLGEGNYDQLYPILKEHRALTIDEIVEISGDDELQVRSGIGFMFRKGEAYYDTWDERVKFRRLFMEELPQEMYTTTKLEIDVLKLVNEGRGDLRLHRQQGENLIGVRNYHIPNPKYQVWKWRESEEYTKPNRNSETQVALDGDGNIQSVKCSCKEFNKGARNISEPCAHILALYMNMRKLYGIKDRLREGREYTMNDIMEILL